MPSKLISWKIKVPMGDTVRTLTRTIAVAVPDQPAQAEPSFPAPVSFDLPTTGHRPASMEELAAIPRQEFPLQWVVIPCGSMLPAFSTVRTQAGTWQFAVPCPYCGVRHVHGADEGARQSHCATPNHPWGRQSYFILRPQ